MLPFRLDKSNLSPHKRGTPPRVDSRSLFPAEHHTETLSPAENKLSRRDQIFEGARKSTQDIVLHGAPLPLVWVLVMDNVIPDYAVPFSEAYGGPQFIARAFLEGHYCIGKAGTGLPLGALITSAGRQLTVKRYEVLCFATEMRWNISQERDYYQQSSFIVSNTARRSYNSLLTSRTEIAASMLLDIDIMRVLPDDSTISMERSHDFSIDKHHCSSPLSPISRHVIEEICSSETDKGRVTAHIAQNPPLSIFTTHHEDDVARNSSEGGHALRSPVKLPSKLFPEVRQAAKGIRRLSATAQSPRSTLGDLTINEDASATHEQSRSLHRARSLSALLPARLTSSRHAETTLEQRNDDSRPHDVPVASPRISSCLSPMSHLSLPEPFNDSADSSPTVTSPKKQARSIGHIIRRNHQDVESEHPSRLTHAKSSNTTRLSSALIGGRRSPGPSLSGPGYRRSALHANYTEDDRSFSDTEIGSNTHSTPAPRIAEYNRTERTLNAVPSGWVGAGSHERKPHIRSAPLDTSVPTLPLRATGSPWSAGKSLPNVVEEVEDCEVPSATFGVNRNRATQYSGGPGAQGRSNVVTLHRPAVTESGQSSTWSSYPSKGDRSSLLRPLSPPAAVPLTIMSPGADRRQLPESQRNQITPLEVSVEARRSRISSNATSGKRESPSSSTRAILSTLGVAAVVGAVASSCTNDFPVASPSGANKDDSATTQSTGYARSAGTMIVQDQCLSEQAVRPTVVATSRLGAQTQRERVELDERVSEETELDVAVEDSWTLENKGSGRPRSLVGSQVSMSGPKPHTTQYLVEPDDVRASGRGYVSNKGTHVDEIERSITQSSQGDMVQIQPSETDDVLTDARSASRKSSYLGKVALGRSSSPYDDTQATDVAMAYTSSYLADVKTKMSDSSTFDGGAHEARERHRLARKPALPAIGEPSQAEKVWESSVDVSRKMTAASPIYGAAPAHSPPDAGHRLGKRAHEEFRQADAVDVDLTWDEAPHTTAPSARQKYLVPLSEYLEPEGHAAGYLVASRERKEVSFGQKSDETRHYRNAIEDSERTRVAQKNEKQEKVTKMNIVADNDGSKATSSKKEGSVVSAVLATACVAALAFEAAAESRQKERSGRTEVNHGKLARDRDHSPVGREPARIIEDNQRVTNEKNVAVTRTAQRTAMVDTPVSQKTAKTAITAQVALGEAETEIHHNSFVDERTSRQERDDDQKRVDWVDSRSGVSAVDVDVRTNERATESTHHSVAAEDAVSVQRTPSAEERTIQKLSSNQKSQTGVESGRALQASETRKQKDESEQATYATRLDTSREQMADMSVGDSNQHASFDVDGIVSRTNDKSAECSARSEGRALIQECNTAVSTCDVERSLAQPNSNPVSSEVRTLVVSPQVHVDVRQVTSVTVASRDAAQSTTSTSADQQAQRGQALTKTSGVDTSNLRKDTGSGSASRPGSSSTHNDKASRLVELSSVDSRQSPVKSVRRSSLNSRPGPAAAGTKPFTKEKAPIPRQRVPIPIASQKQPSVVTNTPSSVRNEQTTPKALNNERSSTTKFEDVARPGDHADRVDEVEQTIQARTQILRDAEQDSDTTRRTLPSVEDKHAKSLESSTETQSAERSNRVTVDERQLRRVSGITKSGTACVDDATMVQKLTSSITSGHVDQSTTLRRAATLDSPERARTTTVYDIGVEMDRTVVGKSTVREMPLREVQDGKEDVNNLHGGTGVSTSEVRTGSNVTCSQDGSIMSTEKTSDACVIENLSIRKNEKQAKVDCVSKAAAQDMNVIEKCALTTHAGSSTKVSDGDSSQSIDKTSCGLVRSKRGEQTRRLDEVAQVMAMANVTTGSSASGEHREASVEVSRVALITEITKCDRPSKGVVRVPSTDPNIGDATPSRLEYISTQDGKVLLVGDSVDAEVSYQTGRVATMTSADYQSEQLSAIETRNAVEKEVDTDDEQMSDYAKNTHSLQETFGVERVDDEHDTEGGDLAGRTTSASSSAPPAYSKLGSLATPMVKGEDRMNRSATYTAEYAVALDHRVGASVDGDTSIECFDDNAPHTERDEVQEQSERIEVRAELQLGHKHSVLGNRGVESIIKSDAASPRQANLPIMSTSSLSRATTSEEALIQSDAHTTSPRYDTRLMDRRIDSIVLPISAQSHAQTDEIHGARRNTNVALGASSERRDKAAQQVQISLDDEKMRVSLTKTSDETVKLSDKSDLASHHRQLDDHIDDECTTIAFPPVATMIRSKDVDSTLVTKEASQFEATEDDADTDISSMASAPPSPLLPTSLPCVSASDRQTPLNTAQTCGSMVESACAVVAIAAAAQLLKESTPERTSSANVMQQQQMKSESEELAVRTQKYDIHEQATSSEHKAISFTTDHSGRHALPRDEVDSSRPLTGIPQQSSTESWQQVPRLDQPTSQACKGEQMRMVSNVGPESRPESLYEQKSSQISSRTEQTMTAQTTTTVEGSPRQVVKGVAGSLHFDIESDYAESLRSSHRSIDEDSSPLDLEQSLPADAFSVQFPHLTHSSHSDSCPSAERPGGIPQYFPYPSESQSPAIMSSPAEYSEAEAGTVTTLANQIHGNVTKHDVGFEEHVSTFSVLADSSSMVPAERIEPRTLDDVRVYPPASSLSPSSLTPTAGEPSVGKRADQVVESSECALSIVHVPPSHGTLGVEYSSGEFTGLASSLAQEERTKIVHMQTTPGVDSDHKWQINTGIHDSKEPPPSYQDAVSDYEYSSVQPSDALTGDEYLSLRQRTQHSGGQKSGTLNVASNEFRQGSEEGASALERRSALRATLLRNDKEVGESTSLPVEGEAVLGTRQKLSIQGVGSASKTDGERVLDQQIGVVSRECASTSGAVTTQHPVETISPFRSTSPYEVRTTPITNSFEDAVSSRRQEYQGHMTTGGIHVSKVDEEKDTNYRCTQRRPVTPTFPQTQATRATLSTAVAMQGNDEGVSNTVSPVLAPENTIILSHSEATESHGCSVTEDDKQVESEDRQCTRRVDGSYEQRRTTQSSDYAGRTSSDRDIEETIISNEHAVVQQEPKSTLTVESTAVHSRTRTKCIDSTPEQPITALTPSASFGRGDVDTFPSSPDAHNARVTFKNTDEYLGTTTATDQLSERIEKEVVEHSTTDIESSRSDLIIRSAVIQTSQLGTSKPQHSVDDVVDSSTSCAQISSGVIQTTRNLNVSASATGIQTSRGHTIENVSSKLDNRNQLENVVARTTVSTSSKRERGTLGDGNLGLNSTLRSSNAKGTSTTSSSGNLSACSEQVVWNAEGPNETSPRSKTTRADPERTGDVTDLESTFQDQGVKTAVSSRMPEKALAAAALVWSASDMTETRAPASKNTTSSPDVGSLSITESTQTSSGGTPRSISVPGERSGRSTTPKPTSSESVRESSPKSVADARISDADGFHLATGSSSVPQSYYSDTTSVHDDVGASSSQDVQRQSSSGEPSTTHLQDVRVDKREGWLVGEDEYDDRDDLVFDSAKEASARSSPLSTLPQAKTTVIFDTRSIQPSPTQTVAHNEKEAHSWEGSVPAIVDRYTDTSPVNSEAHYLQLPTGDHGGIDRSSTASKNFPIPESELSAFETGETQTEAHIMETQGEHGTSNRIESGFALDLEDWMGLNGDSESAGGSLEGVGSVLVCHQYTPSSGSDEFFDKTSQSILALAKRTWRTDVLGTSRRASIVRGWGDLAFVRTISLANRPSHIIDHRLLIDTPPGAIIHTSSSITGHGPIVIVVASITGRPFDDIALITRILSCIDLYLLTPQDLCLLCVVPRKTSETLETLDITLQVVQAALDYNWIEVREVSIDGVDVGYWVKITVQRLFWHEQFEEDQDQEVPHIVEADHEENEPAIAEEASFMDNVDVDMTEEMSAS